MRNSNRTQLTFTYTKSTTETLEKDVNYVHSNLTINIAERCH